MKFNSEDILLKKIENKTIVWLALKNEYIILENTAAEVLIKLNKGIDLDIISKDLSEKLSVPKQNTKELVINLKNSFLNLNNSNLNELNQDYSTVKKPTIFKYTKFYKINNTIFRVDFSNEFELSLVHPKFAHLEVDKTNYDHHFIVFTENNHILLSVNNEIINSWNEKEIHFFQGKFSMELIQKIHQKKEKEWLGVFHASAVSNTKKTILFLGDSGNGKSTSLAILQANGFDCIADDFVPVDAKKQEVYSFPAAISIKRNSLETLLPIYPELKTSAEYHFKRLNKIVRFLPPNNNDYGKHLPCKDLVFIKYKKESDLQFSKIDKIKAFQQLVPDAWLSPEKENAQKFLDWFETLNCYQITYSNNKKMIEKVSKIFSNDS